MALNRVSSKWGVERYRRLACAATIDTERTRLLELMVQEETDYFEQKKALELLRKAGSAH